MCIHNVLNVLGEENIIHIKPAIGGEDFARYGRTKEKIPIFMFRLGTVSNARMEEWISNGSKPQSTHSAYYAPDPEKSIKTGIKAMSGAAINLFKEN